MPDPEVTVREPPIMAASRGAGNLKIRPLEELCPDLKPELVRCLERCLSEDPMRRPTAEGLFEVFKRALGEC